MPSRSYDYKDWSEADDGHIVRASAINPPQIPADFYERMRGSDKGLLTAYAAGINMAKANSQLAERARAGALVILPFKGGLDRKIKLERKYGPLNYFAMWLGLRGDDLEINLDREYEVRCSETGVLGVYSFDTAKYITNQDDV